MFQNCEPPNPGMLVIVPTPRRYINKYKGYATRSLYHLAALQAKQLLRGSLRVLFKERGRLHPFTLSTISDLLALQGSSKRSIWRVWQAARCEPTFQQSHNGIGSVDLWGKSIKMFFLQHLEFTTLFWLLGRCSASCWVPGIRMCVALRCVWRQEQAASAKWRQATNERKAGCCLLGGHQRAWNTWVLPWNEHGKSTTASYSQVNSSMFEPGMCARPTSGKTCVAPWRRSSSAVTNVQGSWKPNRSGGKLLKQWQHLKVLGNHRQFADNLALIDATPQLLKQITRLEVKFWAQARMAPTSSHFVCSILERDIG